MNRKIHFPPCSIVCHGLCEVKIAEHLRSRLRVGIRAFGNNGGKNALEVQNLPSQLTLIPGLQSERDFCKSYRLTKSEAKPFLSKHRIFLMMDQDAADPATWQAYKDGSLFRNLWISPYAIPIYFEPNLDEVSARAGYPIDKKEHKPDQVQKHLIHPRANYLMDLAAQRSQTNLDQLLVFLKNNGYSL